MVLVDPLCQSEKAQERNWECKNHPTVSQQVELNVVFNVVFNLGLNVVLNVGLNVVLNLGLNVELNVEKIIISLGERAKQWTIL